MYVHVGGLNQHARSCQTVVYTNGAANVKNTIRAKSSKF